MKKTFIYNGKKLNLEKLDAGDLYHLGISNEAIKANYLETDLDYYTDGKMVYEALDNTIQGYWDIATFRVWFNEIEGVY